MKKIHCLNPIAKCGTELFPAGYEMTDKAADADAVLVRSASMHDMELPENLLAVGRAGAGVNNIPLDSCAQKGIVVFNTPGANSNGVIYATLAGEFGDETDVGATSILALNDGPFFTMIALGASGMGNFPITDIIASIIPMVIGFIIGNLDHEWRKILATGMILLPPFNGFALGAGMNFNNILRAGISGIVLGLLTVLATGLLTFFLYSALRRKADPMGAAIGTTAGVATTTPTAVAMADPSFQPQVETATAQTAAAVVITAVLCPLLVSWLSKVSRKWNEAHGIAADIPVPEQEGCETQPAATADLD